MSRKRIFIVFGVAFLIFLLNDFCYCEKSQAEERKYTKEFGIFSGWISGELRRQKDYNLIPLYLQFGFNVNSFFEKINIKTKGDFKFIYEPFLNTVVSPDANIETGINFIIKYSYPLTQRFNFYLEAGLGGLYYTQHTYEQGTQFNFSEQGGGGVSFFLTKNKVLSLGYRFRHFSNADIKAPNKGIDSEEILCGISFLY